MGCYAPKMRTVPGANSLRTIWLVAAAFVTAGQAPPGWATVRAARQAPVLSGFATVKTAPDVIVTAVQPGVLTTLAVAPGDTVRPGQLIGRLGGPQIAASLAEAQGANHAAGTMLAAEQSKFADHLTTTAAVAQARAREQAARARLTALEAATRLQSPAAGQVQSLRAGRGATLQAGQPVAVVRPASGAWVKAVLYGRAAAKLKPGQTARFVPANGQPPERVTLRGALGTQADGGLALAFSGKGLKPGEAGTLRLALPARSVLLVPSEALVLDAGRWWVIVRAAHGDHAVQVVPGKTEGTQTPILSGLSAGQQVVVKDAALLYHRGIATLYQPPD